MVGLTLSTVVEGTARAGFFFGLPVVACALLARRVSARAKVVLATASSFVAVAIHAWHLVPLGWLAASYGYYLAVGTALPWLARRIRRGQVTAGASFVLVACAFFVAPSLFWPGAAKDTMLVVGWSLMLSSHSYAVEVSKTPEDPPLRDCLFFLLVNPALVYTHRGVEFGPPALDARGLGRAAAGLALFFAVSALLAPLTDDLYGRAFPQTGPRGTTAMLLAWGGVRFLVEYGRQSAVASLQIGLLKQLGHRIPERFVWPVLARSPLDFWRRWNTYMGQWILRYVFWPLSLELGRARRGPLRGVAAAAGVVVTFGAVGALHDVYVYGHLFIVQTHMLQAFTANGLLIVLWIGGQKIRRALAGATDPMTSEGSGVLGIAARTFMWLAAAGCFVAWWS
jgi:hypothetical protein